MAGHVSSIFLGALTQQSRGAHFPSLFIMQNIAQGQAPYADKKISFFPQAV